MTSFRNAALTTTDASTVEVAEILGSHDVKENEIDLVVYVCLDCHTICSAPDVASKEFYQENYNMTCCSGETTLLP